MLPVLLGIVAVVSAATFMGLFGSKQKFNGKHVLITGGSTGIGLALGKDFITKGAAVTLIARTASKLQSAQSELEASIKGHPGAEGSVQIGCADTTEYEQLAAAIAKASAAFGPVDILVCNAGASYPARFEDTELATFRKLVDLNYLGSVHALKAVFPDMLHRHSGHVVLIASGAAICSFAGYTSYAPTKWAIRGLADSLRNECQGTGVTISIGYPPDTDTPGFQNENLTKPRECVEIAKAVGSVYRPEQVARALMRGIERRMYHLPSPDLVQNLLMDSMASVTPRYLPLPLACLLAPPIAIVLWAVRLWCDHIVRRVRKQEHR